MPRSPAQVGLVVNAWPSGGSPPTGSGRLAQDVADLLLERDVNVAILAITGDPTWLLPVWEERWHGIEVTVAPVPRWTYRGSYRNLAGERLLLDWVAAHRPDLVHVIHPGEAGVGAAAALAQAGWPVVASAIDALYACHMGHLVNARIPRPLCRLPVDEATCAHCMSVGSGLPPEVFLPMQVERRRLAAASVAAVPIVTDSRYVLDELERALPGRYRHSATPPGVGAVEKAPPREGPLRIGFFGTPAWRKGLDTLLEAFRGINGAELVIFGPDDEPAEPAWAARVRAQAETVPGVEWRRRRAAPTEALQVMNEVDVVAVPSRAESLPRVVKEAVALGRPVLASRVAGIPEVVVDGVNGWLLPPDEVDSWRAAIAELATRPGAVRAALPPPDPDEGKRHANDLLELYRERLSAPIPLDHVDAELAAAAAVRRQDPYLHHDELFQTAVLRLWRGRRWTAIPDLIRSLTPVAFDRLETTPVWMLSAPAGYRRAALRARQLESEMQRVSGGRARRLAAWGRLLARGSLGHDR